MSLATLSYQTVKLEHENGITWVILNRPEKRNAMNPQMHFEMLDVLDRVEVDPDTKVMVLTGAGESWCGGQDLKQFFRELARLREEEDIEWASQMVLAARFLERIADHGVDIGDRIVYLITGEFESGSEAAGQG